MNSDEIHELSCPCCPEVLRISDVNAQRLFTAAYDRFGGEVTLDISMMPDVDWTADVSDEAVAVAVERAMASPAPAVTRRRKSKPRRRRP